MIFSVFVLAAALAGSKTVTGNAVAQLEAVGGYVNFKAEPLPLEGKVEITGSTASGWFYVDLTKAKTGDSLRDEHLHEKYMKTKAHPQAKLVVKPFQLGAGDVPFEGTLEIQGVSKPIKGIAAVTGDKFKAKIVWKISDYPQIGAPKIPGLTNALVRDEVEVEVAGEVKG